MGGVAYNYRIGTTEVTNDQYTAFLNAKAQSDPLNLYNTLMRTDARGGIIQSGVSGSFTYAPRSDMGNKPVNFVSWYDAIRFANWLNNGQGGGSTETGAYTLDGGTPTPSNGDSITRNAGAIWFLPNENEWYKAAYYDARTTAQGGPPSDSHYWLYPTGSNSVPTLATANVVGDISNPGPNVANFDFGADWNGQDGNATTVGSAGPLSTCFYGTYDQGGNVQEWNENHRSPTLSRSLRGGAWNQDPTYMWASNSLGANPSGAGVGIGFRVANVPEPSSFVLAALGLIGLAGLGMRRRR